MTGTRVTKAPLKACRLREALTPSHLCFWCFVLCFGHHSPGRESESPI